jgi:phenylalanyl-tRNA synthetase beta chain
VKNKNTFIETQKAAFVFYGKNYDYYSASGISELILKKTGKQVVSFKKCSYPFLHPVNSAEIKFDDGAVGFVGEVHPDICENLDLRFPAFIAEIEIASLDKILNQPDQITPVTKFPPATRDISIVVDQNILARDIQNSLKEYHEWIKEVKYVDLFKGSQIGENKKSVTFSLVFQNSERTLTDNEVNEVMEKVIETAKSAFHAELRV